MTDHATTLSVEALEFLKMLEGSDGGILIRPESCVAPQKNKTEKCCSMETYLKCWKKGDLPFKIIEEENKYRKAVATKDIAKGTFLFGERPVTQVSAAGTKIENAVTCAMGLLSKPCNSALSLIEELCDSTPKGCDSGRVGQYRAAPTTAERAYRRSPGSSMGDVQDRGGTRHLRRCYAGIPAKGGHPR